MVNISSNRQPRALVVNDDPVQLRFAAAILEKEGPAIRAKLQQALAKGLYTQQELDVILEHLDDVSNFVDDLGGGIDDIATSWDDVGEGLSRFDVPQSALPRGPQTMYDTALGWRLINPAMAHASPGNRIIAMLDGTLELNADPQWLNCQMMATLCAELTGETGRLRDTVQAMQLAMIDCWRVLIAAAQEAGQIDPQLDATLWAQWIAHTFIGLLLARKLGTLQAPARQVINELKRLLSSKQSEAPQTGRRRSEAGVSGKKGSTHYESD